MPRAEKVKKKWKSKFMKTSLGSISSKKKQELHSQVTCCNCKIFYLIRKISHLTWNQARLVHLGELSPAFVFHSLCHQVVSWFSFQNHALLPLCSSFPSFQKTWLAKIATETVSLKCPTIHMHVVQICTVKSRNDKWCSKEKRVQGKPNNYG